MYKNQVVLVTGTSKGLGRQICEHFLDQGAHVVGISRSKIAIPHERYEHFAGDVADEKFVQESLRFIRDKYESVYVLVNNAGILSSQLAVLTSQLSAETVIRTNFLGAVVVSRECAKLMIKKKFGRIINVSSMAVPLCSIGSSVYSASKSALTQFTKVLAKELAEHGITCNVLGVSAIETGIWKTLPPKKIEESLNALALKRPATISDITNVIDFFASEASSNITGQVIYLGGAW